MKNNLEKTLNSKTEISEFIKTIEENFSKDSKDQQNVVIKFDEKIEINEFLEILSLIFACETKIKHTADILIKNLSYEHRKKALGLALKTPDLINPIFLTNVFCLIKGYNTFEDSYFEHPQVFLNDEVEFLDIFDDLEQEICEVTCILAEYYVSMLKTCNLVEAVENNPNAVRLDNLYSYLFSAMDVTILAKILSSVKDKNIWETKKIVINSLNYLGQIAEKFVFTNSIMELISKELLKKSIENTTV